MLRKSGDLCLPLSRIRCQLHNLLLFTLLFSQLITQNLLFFRSRTADMLVKREGKRKERRKWIKNHEYRKSPSKYESKEDLNNNWMLVVKWKRLKVRSFAAGCWEDNAWYPLLSIKESIVASKYHAFIWAQRNCFTCFLICPYNLCRHGVDRAYMCLTNFCIYHYQIASCIGYSKIDMM